MEHFILLIVVLFTSVASYAQVSADDVKLFEYMEKTYKVSEEQFLSYVQISSDFDSKLAKLKTERISSENFRSKRVSLYDDYFRKVKEIFNEEQFLKWSSCIERLDRYRYFSEEVYVPRNKMRKLYKIEREWQTRRDSLWNSSLEESKKHQKNEELLTSLQDAIIQVLGEEVGAAYNRYKAIEQMTMQNMNKYYSTYNEALKIAEVEFEYNVKRRLINSDKSRRRSEVEIDLMNCDNQRSEKIRPLISEDLYERWKTVNDNMLDYVLKTTYRLDKSQIVKYKNAYNAYVLEEYEILSSKVISIPDKAVLLERINNGFCDKVKTFFPAATFDKWLGRRLFEFERRMKQKGIK